MDTEPVCVCVGGPRGEPLWEACAIGKGLEVGKWEIGSLYLAIRSGESHEEHENGHQEGHGS